MSHSISSGWTDSRYGSPGGESTREYQLEADLNSDYNMGNAHDPWAVQATIGRLEVLDFLDVHLF